jgi:hypothetical protein
MSTSPLMSKTYRGIVNGSGEDRAAVLAFAARHLQDDPVVNCKTNNDQQLLKQIKMQPELQSPQHSNIAIQTAYNQPTPHQFTASRDSNENSEQRAISFWPLRYDKVS